MRAGERGRTLSMLLQHCTGPVLQLPVPVWSAAAKTAKERAERTARRANMVESRCRGGWWMAGDGLLGGCAEAKAKEKEKASASASASTAADPRSQVDRLIYARAWPVRCCRTPSLCFASEGGLYSSTDARADGLSVYSGWRRGARRLSSSLYRRRGVAWLCFSSQVDVACLSSMHWNR